MFGDFIEENEVEHEDEESPLDLQQSNRDEEIARLLHQRDSLLSHFEQFVPSSNSGPRMMHRSTFSAFDVNALRQRNNRGNNGGGRHRRAQSELVNSVSKTELNDLPIRCIQASDIGKGSESMQSCSICQQKFEIGDNVKTLPCFHFFHVCEIDRWLKTSRDCPVCRHSIDKINFNSK